MTPCNNRENYLKNLRLVNEMAGVDPDVTDLLVAYAGLRLQRGCRVEFIPSKMDAGAARHHYFARFVEKNASVDSRALCFLASYFQEMKSRGLLCVYNSKHLADTLGITCAVMERLAADNSRHYSRFNTAKKDGSMREVLAPNGELKKIQRKILDYLLAKVPLRGSAEGFRKNHSIVTNAARHTGRKVIVKMDIQDFFPSITSGRVFGMFMSLGYPQKVASVLTGLTTFKGRLPTGAPTSPAVSNIVCRRLDKRFTGLGIKCGFSYSRYADDLTFSSDNHNLSGMIPFFKEIIREEGYETNERKLRIMRSGSRQKVTGIIVNNKPNIDRREIRKIRAILHNCHKNIGREAARWAETENRHRLPHRRRIENFQRILLARVQYIRMVNPVAGEKLLAQYKALHFPA